MADTGLNICLTPGMVLNARFAAAAKLPSNDNNPEIETTAPRDMGKHIYDYLPAWKGTPSSGLWLR